MFRLTAEGSWTVIIWWNWNFKFNSHNYYAHNLFWYTRYTNNKQKQNEQKKIEIEYRLILYTESYIYNFIPRKKEYVEFPYYYKYS